MSLGLQSSAFAGAREQAYRIYSRLTGTPPTNPMLAQMTTCINDGNSPSATCTTGLSTAAVNTINNANSVGTKGQLAAAFLAMEDPNNPNFLNIKVKNMVIPWTNKDQTVFAPLNDTATTLIGMIRDGTDFRKALYDNIIYTGNGVSPAYSNSNNNHYVQMEHQNLNLRTVLQAQSQTAVTGHPLASVAGVLTTRASARAFFYAGTNRAMFRFTMLNYLCNDLEQIKDVTRAPDHVHQDVSRSPGGDSSIYLNNCVGCHAGMDGMMGAFAYYNWGTVVFDDTLDPDTQSMIYATSANPDFVLSGKTFSGTRVMPKFLQNFNSFPYGHVTTDDSWINYWRVGPNAKLGWGWGDDTGNSPAHTVSSNSGSSLGSAAQLGYELANTHAFARCQVLKTYRHVCFNDPSEATLENIAGDFKASNFNMLTVFSESAASCSGN
ncbi:MAG: hypothetical protein GC149_04140 [Gammaproteobacteria bacterium]|nr:hypothetical protein [Gammaproteobacteria bacterium]